MDAVRFLFQHKITKFVRKASLYVGYETGSQQLSERLYGLYITAFLVGWVVLVLGWAVVTISGSLAAIRLSPSVVETPLFLGLGGWLALIPARAYRSYDLYRFQSADVDFLSNMPFSARLVTLTWFVKSLFRLQVGAFILVGGVIGSSISYSQHGNDWLGLALGLAAGASFILIAVALLWLLALQKYKPVNLQPGKQSFRFVGSYGSTLIALGLLVVLPWTRLLFWPASLTSWLVVGRVVNAGNSGQPVLALLGLLLTVAVVVLGVWLVAGRILLTPAFEEGRLGGQLRLAASSGSEVLSEARLQLYLSRKFAKTNSKSKSRSLVKARLQGPFGSLLYKQWVRLNRLPVWQLAATTLTLILIGGGTALALAYLAQSSGLIVIVIQVVAFANWSLLRLGVANLRRELAHYDFLVGWPLNRLRLMAYCLLLGFSLPLLSGEIALIVAGFNGLASRLVALWLLIWPLLLSCSALIALLDFQRLVSKWSGTVETVPNLAIRVVIFAGLVWLAMLLGGLTVGMMAAAIVIGGYYLVLGNSLS